MSVSELLFPNRYRRKVLALLMLNPQRWLHLRELARLTGASPGTLKKELDALTSVGLLKLQKVGNQTQFSANSEHPVFPELSALVRKTTGLRDVLALLLWCGWRLRQQTNLQTAGRLLLGLSALQFFTGLSNVVFDWPLLAAVLHTGGAAAMVVTLTWVLSISRADNALRFSNPSRPAE